MAFTFKCTKCGNRKFFQNFALIENKKFCIPCHKAARKQQEALKKQKYSELQKEIEIRKKVLKQEKERRANELLRKQLEQQRKKQLERQRKAEFKKLRKLKSDKKEKISEKRYVVNLSLEQEARKLSKAYSKVLYVYADVKSIKVVEWISGRKRMALNKKRELRRTHKGGFSQEKFQKFIDMKKKQAPDWVEHSLSQGGILRLPYDKVVVDTHDPLLERTILRILERNLN